MLIYGPRRDGRLSWPGWLVTYWNKCSETVTYLSTKRSRRRLTSLIHTNALSLGYAKPPPLEIYSDRKRALYNARVCQTDRPMDRILISRPCLHCMQCGNKTEVLVLGDPDWLYDMFATFTVKAQDQSGLTKCNVLATRSHCLTADTVAGECITATIMKTSQSAVTPHVRLHNDSQIVNKQHFTF